MTEKAIEVSIEHYFPCIFSCKITNGENDKQFLRRPVIKDSKLGLKKLGLKVILVCFSEASPGFTKSKSRVRVS